MTFYENEENVQKYIQMAEGYNGRKLIEKLKTYLPEGYSVLELGSGPGVDLEILNECYKATGSDYSVFFVDRYNSGSPEKKMLQLDAVGIKDVKAFDCIYSNKVLQHLKTDDLEKSLLRQFDVINDDGILLHSCWRGTGTEEFDGFFSVL